MLCLKCRSCNQSVETDKYGNIHIYWSCALTFRSLYHQVTYNPQFLDDLKSGRLYITVEGLKHIIPYKKPFRDIQTIEIMHQRIVTECKDFNEKLKLLDRYWDKI